MIDWQYLSSSQLIEAVTAGLERTVLLTVAASVGALVVGGILTAARVAGGTVLRAASTAYINVVRNVPILIQLFFWYFGFTILFSPATFPFLRSPIFGDTITVLTISIALGGFFSEIFRAGIEAVPRGQIEAAIANGLSKAQAYRHVIFPQLLPIVLPGMSGEVVNVLKSSTFAMTVGVPELMWHAQSLESQTFRGLETMTVVTLVYFCLGLGIIVSFRALERLVQISGPK